MNLRGMAALLVLLSATASGRTEVETVKVAMRDGVRLATDVHRDIALKRSPVVLIRTPYDRTKQKAAASCRNEPELRGQALRQTW
jgi:predicted acyl esterase